MADKVRWDKATGVVSAVLEKQKEFADSVLERAVELAPRDTGELEQSGRLVESKGQVSVVFDADHAAIVHEDLETDYQNGESKFLEKAIKEHVGSLPEDFTIDDISMDFV